MTWQQKEQQRIDDRLRERWNEDGTRKLNVNAFDVDGTPITSVRQTLSLNSGCSITFPKPEEGQEGWIINDVQYVPLNDLCN